MISRLILLSIIALAMSCSTKKEVDNGKLKVLSTTGMLHDAVLNIGGDLVESSAIMGPGVDPHLYKATQGDLSRLREADIVVYNGLKLEGKMEDILEKLGKTKPTFPAAKSIPDSILLNAVNYQNAFDPHIWFDVSLWSTAVQEISKQLQAINPENAEVYKANSRSYLSALDTLDTYVRQRIQEIPPTQRVLVTAHDAFGYFGRAYGIEVKGLQGISTVSDFGLKDIAELTDLIISKDIKAIFVETSVSDKAIKAVISGCEGKGHQVEIGGYLYSDAMGEFGTTEGTYIGMVKANVDLIVEALK